MAIRYYDDALAAKINSWLPKDKNRTIQVLKPDETRRMFTIEANEKNDKPISLPLIALSRGTSIDMIYTAKSPLSFDGLKLAWGSNGALKINAIPISLTYQLDIYTRHYDEGDALLRNFIFQIINNPQLVIELPYNNQNLKQVASIKLQGQAEDTSDIAERVFPGQFTRWTLRIDVLGAYLYDLPYVPNVYIDEIGLAVAKKPSIDADYQEEEI